MAPSTTYLTHQLQVWVLEGRGQPGENSALLPPA